MTSIELQSTVEAFPLRREHADAERPVPALASNGTRRAFNFLVALAAAIVVAPMMVFIAIVIKVTSRGPVIYTQRRVGVDRRIDQGEGNHRRRHDLGGRPFTIYKFRTMRASPTAAAAQTWASPDDPRVTRVGRFLRQYRLDELPQLVNVLRGDMNVVGPRPEQPDIFVSLRDQISHYQARQRVLPGITGWAQINHHYDTSVDDVRRKTAYDLEYVARCSALQDLEIMLKTIPVMVFKKGAW